MLIRFLRDFRSAATGENFYASGDIAELERGAEVVAEGAAEPVEDSAPLPFEEAPAKRGRPRKV